MLDDSLFSQADEHLQPEDFSLDSHLRIYRAIAFLVEAGNSVDIVTLAERLRARKEVESVGGLVYLAALTEGLPRRLKITEYVKIVKDKSRLRQIIRMAERTKSRAFDQSESAEQVLSDTHAELEAAVTEATASTLEPISHFYQKTYPSIDTFHSRAKEATGVPYGFGDLDAITNGMHGGDLIIVAARPGMGKTALAANVADNVAIRQRKAVAFFSLEMAKKAVLDRLASARSGVALSKLRMGFVSSVEKRYIEEAVADIVNESLLFVDDTPSQTLRQMVAKSLRMKQESGLDLIVVDYLQLITPTPGAKGENREQQIAGISRGAKAWARKLDVPVMMLAQLNRSAAKPGASRKPVLTDLRESGAIEQDADVVLFIHREEYYEATDENQGQAELILAKQRQGSTDTIHCHYSGLITKFISRAVNPNQKEF